MNTAEKLKKAIDSQIDKYYKLCQSQKLLIDLRKTFLRSIKIFQNPDKIKCQNNQLIFRDIYWDKTQVIEGVSEKDIVTISVYELGISELGNQINQQIRLLCKIHNLVEKGLKND